LTTERDSTKRKPESATGAFRLPVILGIVNLTRDSFSDGGRYLAPEAALAQAHKLVKDGASVLDLGAAASNPKAEAVAPEEEIARLKAVVKTLKQDGVPLSIDSFSPEVQRWALGQNVEYLNDIHGFPDPALYPALAAGPAKLIVMHAVQEQGRATALDIPAETIFPRILDFFAARIAALEQGGIARSRLILDPGMGFFLGSRREASFEVLRRLPELKTTFGLPVLICVSRKSFLRRTAGRSPQEAGPASLTAELFAVLQGSDYIRTHDPAALADGLAVWTAALTGNTTSS
jgi:dihydropteroate synthase type 2